MKKSFASDNYSGVHPIIMDAIMKANSGHVSSYGNDELTREASLLFKDHFGVNSETFFVFLGTGANVLSLTSALQPYQAVLCTNYAHINVDECGAPERFGGFKLLSTPSCNGKFDINNAKKYLANIGFEHNVQPKVISISQTTELGTVYTVDEIKEIADFAHQNDMLLHMDGARISNAAATLNLPFKAFTAEVGVDILSFGGTKNGMMYGEAVVFLNNKLSNNFKYLRKQSMQLASKMRFISAQFIAYLTDNHCMITASHANKMAQYMKEGLEKIPAVAITQNVEANAIFAIIPRNITEELQKVSFFYIWNDETNEARFMTSWDTTKEDVDNFITSIKNILRI